jgi:hypothetical protein
MPEWASFIAVFWLLWAIDGVRIAPRAIFTVAEWVWDGWLRRTWTTFSRLSLPGPWGSSWRVTTADVPLAISPHGICNRPVGAAGRPADAPHVARAWGWEEVREVTAADGWLVVNGAKFCPDTGHVGAAELLALAKLPAASREARLRVRLRRWLRPAHLRRRQKKLCGRTQWVAALNSATFSGFGLLSVYVIAEVAGGLPAEVSARIVTALPWVVLALLLAHFAGVFAAWRALKRLPAVAAHKRGLNLFTAALMPPQALKLRALVGEGFFPAQHPLAVVLAFGGERVRREAAFHTLSDLHWPIGGAGDPPLAREIAAWHRAALRAEVEPHLRAAGLAPEALLAAPRPDGSASCAYCPRCGDQFVPGRTACPQGVALKALPPR